MKLEIKRNDLLDFFIYIIVIFDILIFRWLGVTSFVNVILLILVTVAILKSIVQRLNLNLLLYFFMIPLYFFINIRVTSTSFLEAINNFKEILLPLLFIMYYSILIRYKSATIKYFINKSFSIFNLFAIINIPIILLQVSGIYAFNGPLQDIVVGSSDVGSGLFGANGTPQLALFSAFIIIYNFYYATKNNSHNKIIIIYNIILAICYMILSMMNDNKFFYVILFVYLFIFFVNNFLLANRNSNVNTKISNVITRMVPLLILLIGLIVFLYSFTQVGNSIDQMMHDVQIGIEKTYLVQGSNERFGMLSFILQDTAHKWIGYGIGYATWTTPFTFGFAHFGQSNLGSFLCLGGILFGIVILFYVGKCVFNCVYNKVIAILFLMIILILSTYTQIFTSLTLMGNVLLFLSLCGIKENEYK